jgi:hypothetical protein
MQAPVDDCVHDFEARAYATSAEMEAELATCAATLQTLQSTVRDGNCVDMDPNDVVGAMDTLHRSLCTLRQQIDNQRRFIVREMSYHHSIAANVLSPEEMETVHARSQFTA